MLRRALFPHSASVLMPVVGATVVMLMACGGAATPPDPATTPTATPAPSATPIPPPLMPTPEPPIATAPATEPAVRASCVDPYPEGPPYTPDPDEPVRIRPAGQQPPLARYEPMALVRDPGLKRAILDSIGGEKDRFGIVVKNLGDGRGYTLSQGKTFYAASLFKTWIMLSAFGLREGGDLDFSETYVVTDFYQEFGVSAGQLEACDRVTVGEVVDRMIRVSDNVAANLLLDRVNAPNVDAALRDLGLTVSRFAGEGRLPTTAADMALLLEAIARRVAVSERASDDMLRLLSSEVFSDRIAAQLPAGTRVAHKTGNWSNATHDAGIVFSPRATYVIVVLTDYGFSDDGARRIAELSRAVYDYFNGG